ncbi:uncharacterized protein LOC108135903 isoform X1 [Drosophila elegans]|uniref:uncharacterized protein LOC108135903 isoform X1 n=1 Tax=Drosophila elegans TaxID=30023 RepID=UPI0007E7BB50|nr:uncharacterized protein LOC108135903 isoform X1 [Drosophila elegans]
MFELRHISFWMRRIIRHLFHRDDAVYSIWNFPTRCWNQSIGLLHSCCLCRTEWFPVIFWPVVLLSLCGAGSNCYELMQVWSCPCWQMNMWRQRHFYVLNDCALRKARLVGSSFSLIAWLMLVYGILRVSPSAISPWILVTSIVLTVDWLMWSFDVITGRLSINLHTVLSHVLHVFFLGMVCCVKNVFEVALDDHREHSLRII